MHITHRADRVDQLGCCCNAAHYTCPQEAMLSIRLRGVLKTCPERNIKMSRWWLRLLEDKVFGSARHIDV